MVNIVDVSLINRTCLRHSQQRHSAMVEQFQRIQMLPLQPPRLDADLARMMTLTNLAMTGMMAP